MALSPFLKDGPVYPSLREIIQPSLFLLFAAVVSCCDQPKCPQWQRPISAHFSPYCHLDQTSNCDVTGGILNILEKLVAWIGELSRGPQIIFDRFASLPCRPPSHQQPRCFQSGQKGGAALPGGRHSQSPDIRSGRDLEPCYERKNIQQREKQEWQKKVRLVNPPQKCLFLPSFMQMFVCVCQKNERDSLQCRTQHCMQNIDYWEWSFRVGQPATFAPHHHVKLSWNRFIKIFENKHHISTIAALTSFLWHIP